MPPLPCFWPALCHLQAQTAPKPLRIPIEQYKLDNGLRIVMSVDHSAPTYGISITYNVGSHNEHAGRTGFAHLFEHMMFEGSQNVGKGEHMILVENNGGDMNGTTTEDRTNYFESFASNQLDLGLFLEVGPHAFARGESGQSGQSAQRRPRGAPPGRRQSAVRRNFGSSAGPDLRQFRQQAFGDRLHDRT